MGQHKRRKNKKKNNQEKDHWLSIFWRSRSSLLVLLAVFVFVSVSVLKEAVLRVERQQEIVELESEIARLESRNARIGDAITVLNSSSKQDKLSRTKLGVQRPGEKVVFFPGDQVQPDQVYETPGAESVEAITPEKSNPEKWMHYFMGQYK
jgi:cell division protein FtsB